MAAIEIDTVTTTRRWSHVLLAVSLVPLTAATIAWLCAGFFYLGDLITFFLPVLTVASLLVLVLAAISRRRRAFVIALVLTVVNSWPVLTPVPSSSASASGPDIRVATSNVLGSRWNYDSLIKWSVSSGIDVLGQQEVHAHTLSLLAPLGQHFPFVPPQEVIGRDPEVTAWSTWKLLKATRVTKDIPIPDDGWGGQALRLELAPPGLPDAATQSPKVVVYVLHPTTPRSEAQWQFRNLYLEIVARTIAAEPTGTPIVVLGDFNTPTWSPFYRRFMADTGLVDAAGTNWPSVTRFARRFKGFFHFGAPVDHILVSPQIEVRNFELGPDVESDHLPVIADLRLP